MLLPEPQFLMETFLPVKDIRADRGVNTRATINEDRVKQYAQALREKARFPPIIVMRDRGKINWVADGFKRHGAHVIVGEPRILCSVYLGEKRDALLWSCGANSAEGRTEDDLDRAIEVMLRDEHWRKLSLGEIARHCHTNMMRVSRLQRKLSSTGVEDAAVPERSPTVTVNRGGTSYEMNTTRIGVRTPVVLAEADLEPPPTVKAPPQNRSYEQKLVYALELALELVEKIDHRYAEPCAHRIEAALAYARQCLE